MAYGDLFLNNQTILTDVDHKSLRKTASLYYNNNNCHIGDI